MKAGKGRICPGVPHCYLLSQKQDALSGRRVTSFKNKRTNLRGTCGAQLAWRGTREKTHTPTTFPKTNKNPNNKTKHQPHTAKNQTPKKTRKNHKLEEKTTISRASPETTPTGQKGCQSVTQKLCILLRKDGLSIPSATRALCCGHKTFRNRFIEMQSFFLRIEGVRKKKFEGMRRTTPRQLDSSPRERSSFSTVLGEVR